MVVQKLFLQIAIIGLKLAQNERSVGAWRGAPRSALEWSLFSRQGSWPYLKGDFDT